VIKTVELEMATMGMIFRMALITSLSPTKAGMFLGCDLLNFITLSPNGKIGLITKH
jgi:hypothetical protein